MAVILSLETATESCSVALSKDGKVLAERTQVQASIHASKLTIFIEQTVKEAGLTFEAIDAIAVSKGPGSYTGLRIGVASAKGLCFALDKPLIAIGTLEAMAWGYRQQMAMQSKKPFLLCPMIDARRMEVYSAFYDLDLREQKAVSADVLDEESYAAYFDQYQLIFMGNGAAKCRQLQRFEQEGVFIPDFHSKASFLVELAEEQYRNQQFEGLINFEPYYLKDFVAGVKKSAL